MKKIFIALLILATTAFILLAITYARKPEILRRGYHRLREVICNCDDYDQADCSNRLNDRMNDYIKISEKLGIPACKDESELMIKLQNGELFKVTDGYGYKIDRLRYSYPYLTKSTTLLLKELGKDFQEKISGTRLKDTRLIVTSMTRSIESLGELKEDALNKSKKSAHLNCNAIDISYSRFKSKRLFLCRCDKRYLKAALSEVICNLRFQQQKCWATYERYPHCFHIVAK